MIKLDYGQVYEIAQWGFARLLYCPGCNVMTQFNLGGSEGSSGKGHYCVHCDTSMDEAVSQLNASKGEE